METSETTDEEIAARVQRGDSEAFNVLMKRYEPKLTRYGKKFLSDADDIQDFVQEAFIKTYVNIQSFDAKRRFSPWIYRIAHNEFVNAIKKKWSDRIIPFDLDLLLPYTVAKETADSEVNRQDIKRMLDQCLKQLHPHYREPLVLYYYEDMDYREIAEILQIPTSTVGVRLKRGKTMLKKFVASFNEIHGKQS